MPSACRFFRICCVIGAVAALSGTPVVAASGTAPGGRFASRALPGTGAHVETRTIRTAGLPPDDPLRVAWARFALRYGDRWQAWIDERSGMPTMALGNGIPWYDPAGPAPSLEQLEALARALLREHADALGGWNGELVLDEHASRASDPQKPRLVFQQVVGGVPVEGAGLMLSLGRGRLVALGAAQLSTVRTGTAPAIDENGARAALHAYLGLTTPAEIQETQPAALVLLPVEPDLGVPSAWARGAGYGHRLTWRFRFSVPADHSEWLARVDARNGQVVQLLSLMPSDGAIVGSVRSVRGDWPIVHRFPMPNAIYYQGPFGHWNTANTYGLFGTLYPYYPIETKLHSMLATASDECGELDESLPDATWVDLGTGTGGDCGAPAGHSAGDTDAARTAFYHVNRAKEWLNGWIPWNTWVTSNIWVHTNDTAQTCNGKGNGSHLTFGRAGAGCRNMGEQPGIILHEFGHGFDEQAQAAWDQPVEAFADVAAILYQRDSCADRGSHFTNCSGYGDTCLDCTGIRDQDWDAHTAHQPADLSWPATHCGAEVVPWYTPCNYEAHCEGAIAAEAVYDLVTRDLPASGMDLDTAWELADRLFIQSENVGSILSWNLYDCGSANGSCDYGNWYNRFRLIDDDDGDLSNGTPHAAALYDAFARHQIACGNSWDAANQSTSSCPALARPTLSVATVPGGANLNWTGVPDAAAYRILRSDRGCDLSQLVAGVAYAPATSYADTGLIGNTEAYYRVQAVGSNGACDGPVSNCVLRGQDTDGDGWGPQRDCSELDPSIHPGAGEKCDGVDSDCNGQIPEGEYDHDGDGYVECYGWTDPAHIFPDIHGGGDCADTDPSVHPGTAEACNGRDDNCDGSVPLNERDEDGDGWAACSSWSDPTGQHPNILGGGDCDDHEIDTHPYAGERCDGKDNDCNGALPGSEADRDADRWVECAPYVGSVLGISGGGDCDDLDDLTHPGAPEQCDGTDNSCDGQVPADEQDGDSDGYVECSPWNDYHEAFPQIVGGGDCSDSNPAIHPGAAEICDGRDNDCNGTVPTLETDHDGDHWVPCEPWVGTLHGIYGGGDCNDYNAFVHPGASEACNHLDDDCDGVADDGLPQANFALSVPGGTNQGTSVATLGDVDGDGTPDFLVGAPDASHAGEVVLYSGATRAEICRTATGQADSRLGTAIAALSDLNHDLVPDFVASAPGYDPGFPQLNNGGLFIYSGANCQLIRTCVPGGAGERVGDGQGLAAYGTILIAGAPYYHLGSNADAGRAYRLRASDCTVTLTVSDPSGAANDHLGLAVAALDDLDADGTRDIAVAAPDYDARGTDRGEVLVFSGRDGTLLRSLITGNPTEGGRLGASLASIVDLDGDGVSELIAGEPGADLGGGYNAGRILVFSPENGSILRETRGAAGEELGTAVAAVADRNGDGVPDLAGGAPGADADGTTDAGAVRLFSGVDAGALWTYTARAGASAALGRSVSDLGDVTNDSARELLAGAPGASTTDVLGTQTDCDGDGYTPLGGDCSDVNAQVHPGAFELCNGTDDDCDGSIDEGAGGPGYVNGLAVAADRTTITWPAQSGAESYDVAKGSLLQLEQSGGNFTSSLASCLANNTAATSVSDAATPAVANGFYYLYRSIGCGGQPGTYDDGSTGQVGSRDEEIHGSRYACP